jgi:hypothetical protein
MGEFARMGIVIVQELVIEVILVSNVSIGTLKLKKLAN